MITVLVFLGTVYVGNRLQPLCISVLKIVTGQLMLSLWGGITITRSVLLPPEPETMPISGCIAAPPSQTEGIKISWLVPLYKTVILI